MNSRPGERAEGRRGARAGASGEDLSGKSGRRSGPPFGRERALAECARLPRAELCHPFGESPAVFKVAGKMFAVISLDDHPGRITLKCDPGYGAALADKYREITPGYHMSKRHWITVALLPSLAPDLVAALIAESYELVSRGSARPAG